MIIQFFPLYFKLLHRSLIVQSISNNYTYTYQLTSYGYVKSDNFPFVFFFFCTHVIKQTHLTAFANNIIKNTNKTQLKIDMENSNKILHFLYVIFEFLFFSLWFSFGATNSLEFFFYFDSLIYTILTAIRRLFYLWNQQQLDHLMDDGEKRLFRWHRIPYCCWWRWWCC